MGRTRKKQIEPITSSQEFWQQAITAAALVIALNQYLVLGLIKGEWLGFLCALISIPVGIFANTILFKDRYLETVKNWPTAKLKNEQGLIYGYKISENHVAKTFEDVSGSWFVLRIALAFTVLLAYYWIIEKFMTEINFSQLMQIGAGILLLVAVIPKLVLIPTGISILGLISGTGVENKIFLYVHLLVAILEVSYIVLKIRQGQQKYISDEFDIERLSDRRVSNSKSPILISLLCASLVFVLVTQKKPKPPSPVTQERSDHTLLKNFLSKFTTTDSSDEPQTESQNRNNFAGKSRFGSGGQSSSMNRGSLRQGAAGTSGKKGNGSFEGSGLGNAEPGGKGLAKYQGKESGGSGEGGDEQENEGRGEKESRSSNNEELGQTEEKELESQGQSPREQKEIEGDAAAKESQMTGSVGDNSAGGGSGGGGRQAQPTSDGADQKDGMWQGDQPGASGDPQVSLAEPSQKKQSKLKKKEMEKVWNLRLQSVKKFLFIALISLLVLLAWWAMTRKKKTKPKRKIAKELEEDEIEPVDQQTAYQQLWEDCKGIAEAMNQKKLDPRQSIVALYQALIKYYANVGFERNKFDTPDEYYWKHAEKWPRQVPQMKAVTLIFNKVMYSNFSPEINDVDQCLRNIQALCTQGSKPMQRP